MATIWLVAVALMALCLMPFFEHWRGTPHQRAAIKKLEEAIPAEVLQEDAEWFEAWKESGVDQEVWVPYFSQMDNGPGALRECFTSAAAMVAAYWGRVTSDDEYSKIRATYGDTTSVDAHVQTLRSLGLEVEFRKDADAEMVMDEIRHGRPVLVGWLHEGDLLRGEPPMCSSATCGHWSVITGFRGRWSADPEFILHDPRGRPDFVRGGHTNPYLGQRVHVRVAEFLARWKLHDGAWVILVDQY